MFTLPLTYETGVQIHWGIAGVIAILYILHALWIFGSNFINDAGWAARKHFWTPFNWDIFEMFFFGGLGGFLIPFFWPIILPSLLFIAFLFGARGIKRVKSKIDKIDKENK